MRKESLQEATQRVLLDGYKNLKENKSKKIETKLEDIQMEIYEMIQDGRRLDKQDKATNIKETIKAIKSDYPDINEKDLKSYVQRKAEEIYAGEYDEKESVKAKKTEGVLKNIQLEDEIDEWKVYSADIDKNAGKNIIATFKNYENDEGNVINNIRIDYNTKNKSYIVNYVDNNGRFHQINYKLSDEELAQIAGSKKVEAKEELSSPDYLEKAFEVEVEYWLQALVDEDSNDEIGKKAQAVLDDKNKMKEIVNELVEGSDDLWEDIHRRIEELAGLHYRESSRVNESKKASW